jgi:glycosyltransferase involved in cell wall biosynthesis
VSLPAVIFLLPQSGAAADGGIASIGEIIARLRNHRPVIVTNRPTAQVERWRESGIETHVVPFGSDPASYARMFGVLRRLISSTGAKVIHANKPLALQLALAPAKLSGTKLVLNLRDTIDPGRRPVRAKYRALFAAADHVLFLSNDMADRWAKLAANAKRRFSVTYSIVDPQRFAPSPPSSPEPPVVLLSGIIRPKKGQLEFLQQVAPILAERGIHTWLAGDFDPAADPYMKACAEAAAPLGDSVKFLGYRADIPKLMQRSAAIAVPSRHEGLVRAMVEAMASARPVVSFDVCSAREMLEGGAGTIVKAGDFRGMAEALIGYCLDRDVATAAGTSGAALAAELFAPEAVVQRYERIYERLEDELARR